MGSFSKISFGHWRTGRQSSWKMVLISLSAVEAAGSMLSPLITWLRDAAMLCSLSLGKGLAKDRGMSALGGGGGSQTPLPPRTFQELTALFK